MLLYSLFVSCIITYPRHCCRSVRPFSCQ